MATTRICNTPGCGRSCPSSEHAYCSDCIGFVIRTGREPLIQRTTAFEPEWLRRARQTPQGLRKDLTGAAA